MDRKETKKNWARKQGRGNAGPGGDEPLPHGWYYRLSEFFARRYPFRVRKVPLDSGMTCPNRDGTLSRRGCTFCYNPGFSPEAGRGRTISRQLASAWEKLGPRGQAKTRFLAYFQSYTNTYGPWEKLEELYREALGAEGVIGLAVATRPDCVTPETLDLLQGYAGDKHVWLEYGLQTAHDPTLVRINRGHTREDFTRALEMTRGRGIFTCAHIILGLPGETRTEMEETIRFLNRSRLDGVKVHHLQVIRNTPLEEEYRRGRVKTLAWEDYLPLLADLLEILHPNTAVHRLVSEVTDPGLLVAPRWDLPKAAFYQELEKELRRRKTYQGARYS